MLPVSNNALYHALGIVSASGCLSTFNVNVLMVSRATLCSEILPKEQVVGFDAPFLLDESSVVQVHHAIVASIDAALFPIMTTFTDAILEINHNLLLPT